MIARPVARYEADTAGRELASVEQAVTVTRYCSTLLS
jgi:hypothetical protein